MKLPTYLSIACDLIMYISMLQVWTFFVHNHITIDDCAYGLDVEEYNMYPVAVVKKNRYITRPYFELSVFYGFFEVLVTGGYYCKSGASPYPFLGFSLQDWPHDELKAGLIYTSRAQANQVIPSERLLNKYCRRNARQLWGFHSSCSYLNGFAPISPLHMMDHKSQKDKGINVHHFASKLLRLVSSRKWITADVVLNVFLFLASSSKFRDICIQSNYYAINFSDFKMVLDGLMNKPVYLSFLVNFAASIEEAVNQVGSCYVFNLHTIGDLSKKALNVMKNGLKGELDKENSKIVAKEAEKVKKLST